VRHNQQTEEQLERANEMSERVGQALTAIMRDSARSDWSKNFRIGVSDIGHCREYLRRLIKQEPFSDEQDDYSAAFMGTAVGALAEEAMVEAYAGQSQMTVEVKLQIGDYQLTIPGHPDYSDGENLLDFKTKDGLAVIRRTGPEDQQRWQLTLYAAALIETGELPPEPWLHLVYIDRSGREQKPVTFSWQYSEDDLRAAMQWLDDVIYALANDEEASKDKPRDWCFACCPYAGSCRGGDTDAQGLIADPEVIDAKRIYIESSEGMKALEKDKKSAMSVLQGRAGVVDGYVLRWIEIPEGDIAASTRSAYKRISLKPLR
jgi:hypothetical protein